MDEDATWADRWLSSVSAVSMTQRKLTVIESHGGIKQMIRRAKKHGVHLLLLTDDKGNELVAASRHPFKVLC